MSLFLSIDNVSPVMHCDEPEGIEHGPGLVNHTVGGKFRVWLYYLVQASSADQTDTWVYAFEDVGSGAYPAWLRYQLDGCGWKTILGTETFRIRDGGTTTGRTRGFFRRGLCQDRSSVWS